MTTPEALKALYAALGGTSSDVAGLSKTVDLLNAISTLLGGTGGALDNPEALSGISRQLPQMWLFPPASCRSREQQRLTAQNMPPLRFQMQI